MCSNSCSPRCTAQGNQLEGLANFRSQERTLVPTRKEVARSRGRTEQRLYAVSLWEGDAVLLGAGRTALG